MSDNFGLQHCFMLPNTTVMAAALKSVNDDEHVAEHFHSILLAQAGKERVPEGLAVLLKHSAATYCLVATGNQREAVYSRLGRYIDVLSEEPSVQEYCKRQLLATLLLH